MQKAIRLGALAMLAGVHLGCSDKAPTLSPASQAPVSEVARTGPAPPNQGLEALAEQQLSQAVQASTTLKTATTQLLNAADLTSLTEAQNAWFMVAKRSEAFYVFSRLGALPHTNHEYLAKQQYAIGAWPIAPGYLDTYGDYPYSGLVFDIGLPLSAESLREQHGLTALSDATLGIYAIEYILFGENNNRGPLLFRPITTLNEQHRATGYEQIEELPRNRRRQLLQLQVNVLEEDLQQLQHYWEAQRPVIRDTDFKQAAGMMITEHILAAAQLQTPMEGESLQQRLWRGEQLAQRIASQLAGWHQGLALLELPNRADLILVTQNAMDRLRTLAEQEVGLEQPSANELKALQGQWQLVYQDLRNLATALMPLSSEASLPLDDDQQSEDEQLKSSALPPVESRSRGNVASAVVSR